MKGERYDFESDIEKYLREDAEKIDVDLKFKKELKNIIMKDKVVNINNFRRKRINYAKKYLKIASSFFICVFLGGNLYHLASVPTGGDEYSVQDVEYKNRTIAEVTKLREISVDEIENVKSFRRDIFEVDSDTNKENLNNSHAIGVLKNKTDVSNEQKNDWKDTQNKDKSENKKGSTEEIIIASNRESEIELGTDRKSEEKDESSNDSKINDLLEDKRQNNALSPVEKPTGPIVVKPTEKEELISNDENIQIYDSSTSKEGMVEIKSDENVLYAIKDGKKESILELEDGIKIENPNLLGSGNIIYARNISNDDNTIYIYLYDVNLMKEEKLFEGKDPMISSDGNMLAYEFKGEILVSDLANNVTKIIDRGNYPSWSYNGKYLSYVKEEIEYSQKDENEKKIEKVCSSLWIYNLENGEKYPITNKEFITDNKKIDKWAQEVRDDSVNIKYDVIPKYTYYESIWSIDDMKIYVIRRDNDKEVYDLVEFTLN